MRSHTSVCEREGAPGEVRRLPLKHGALLPPPDPERLLSLLPRSSTPLSNGPWRSSVRARRSSLLTNTLWGGSRMFFFFFFCCFRPLRLDVLMLLFYFMFFLLHALPTALSPSLWCFMFVFSFIGMWKKKYNNLAADQIVSLQQFRPSRGSGRGWIFSVAASPGS